MKNKMDGIIIYLFFNINNKSKKQIDVFDIAPGKFSRAKNSSTVKGAEDKSATTST